MLINLKTKKKVFINILKAETACLTGHRPNKLLWHYNESTLSCIKFKEDLYKILEGAINYGIKIFLTGMAEGFDMIATEILLKLRKIYKIKIIAVIPCLGQEKLWQPSQQDRYHKIIKQCDNKVIISNTYTNTCMNDRNKYMVEHSSIVVACYNGAPSGTANTIKFAKERGRKIRIVNPNNY